MTENYLKSMFSPRQLNPAVVTMRVGTRLGRPWNDRELLYIGDFSQTAKSNKQTKSYTATSIKTIVAFIHPTDWVGPEITENYFTLFFFSKTAERCNVADSYQHICTYHILLSPTKRHLVPQTEVSLLMSNAT